VIEQKMRDFIVQKSVTSILGFWYFGQKTKTLTFQKKFTSKEKWKERRRYRRFSDDSSGPISRTTTPTAEGGGKK